MKLLKKINVFSNGSFCFCYTLETSSNNNKLVFFRKVDDKNFALNQKKVTSNIDSKYSLYYKKKYLK